MREINLTQGYVALVDDEDYEKLNAYKWHVKKFKNVIYARRITIDKKHILMHREILGVYDNNELIDHKDRNGLNNQKGNLRKCNRAQNRANAKPCGISKYLGITRTSTAYYAVVFKNKKGYRSKSFPLTEEGEKMAALAYNEKAIEIHGEFANLNIVE